MSKNSHVLLGISFETETYESVLKKIQDAWARNAKLRIATVNPEFLVEAHADNNFRENLTKADVRLVDGFGLWLALWLSGLTTERITGVTLTKVLLHQAEQEQKKVVVILSQAGLSTVEQVRQVLQKEYPSLLLEILTLPKNEAALQAMEADLFLVALGAPEQEHVAEEIQKGVALGVGGTFDFFTGTQKRAPKVMQYFGLEWLYRLLRQPHRLGRIIRAVIIFPLIFIGERALTICRVRLVQ